MRSGLFPDLLSSMNTAHPISSSARRRDNPLEEHKGRMCAGGCRLIESQQKVCRRRDGQSSMGSPQVVLIGADYPHFHGGLWLTTSLHQARLISCLKAKLQLNRGGAGVQSFSTTLLPARKLPLALPTEAFEYSKPNCYNAHHFIAINLFSSSRALFATACAFPRATAARLSISSVTNACSFSMSMLGMTTTWAISPSQASCHLRTKEWSSGLSNTTVELRGLSIARIPADSSIDCRQGARANSQLKRHECCKERRDVDSMKGGIDGEADERNRQNWRAGEARPSRHAAKRNMREGDPLTCPNVIH